MYSPKNFDNLLGTPGFSDTLLKNHFTLYEGYVKNINLLASALEEKLKNNSLSSPEYAELKRRFGWEYNGMRLHELYFGNMKHANSTPPSPAGESGNANAPIRIDNAALDKNTELYKMFTDQFGSYDTWLKDFKATGTMRGIGWTILYKDNESGKLFNTWVNEHDMGHLTGASPLLVLDVFEHAYTLDYGLKKADYIEAFFNAIDWNIVNARHQ